MRPCTVLYVLLSLVLLSSCAHISPQASLGDFTDQVIEPLASRMAEETFMAKRAAVIAAHTPEASFATVTSLLGEVPMLGRFIQWGTHVRKTQLDADLAWLETRRLPLKQELRDLFVARTVKTDEGFAFCADGKQRRYRSIEGTRFSRLEDGAGPCELTQLHSLRRQPR